MPGRAGETLATDVVKAPDVVRVPSARRSSEELPQRSPLPDPASHAALGSAESGRSLGVWFRRWGFWLEFVLCLLAGASVAALADPDHLPAVLGTFAVWVIANFYVGPAITSPLPKQLRIVGRSVLPPLGVAALLVGYANAPAEVVPAIAMVIAVAAGISAVFRALRWRIQSPIRVVAVGDTMAISSLVSRWEGQDRVQPVAAVLLEPDTDETPAEIMGVPVVAGLEAIPEVVEAFRSDLVVVAPGPGFTSVEMRQLAWSVESTRAALGVTGVLDMIAPHRITPGTMLGATITDVRSARQTLWVRASKAVVDRAIALILLVLVSPVLLAMTAAIRLDSKGAALFKQTRVGLHGRDFTVYKMRTMYLDAEARLAELQSSNESDDVLFKMKDDPRITRVGKFLRRTSLDELPQLINVVRGDMSLVGPRPALRSEIEAMGDERRRRLVVRPGITGLWQVSGRSELGPEEAAALDTYYADNWHLTGDASILVRTVKAVVGAKGAY